MTSNIIRIGRYATVSEAKQLKIYTATAINTCINTGNAYSLADKNARSGVGVTAM